MTFSDSRTSRVLFVGSLVAAIVAMIVLTAVVLWPEWQKYQAALQLKADIEEIGAVPDDDFFAYSKACGVAYDQAEKLKKMGGGARAADVLVPMLKDHRLTVRARAAQILAVWRWETKDIVPVLIEELNGDEGRVRHHAAIALDRVASIAKEAGPALSDGLKEAVPPLIDALTDSFEPVQLYAALALGKIDPQTAMEIARKDAEENRLSQAVRTILSVAERPSVAK